MSDLRTDPHNSMTPTGGTDSGARTMTIISFVCAAVAILFLPILFGPASIVLGILAYKRGDKLGMYAAIAGGVCMVIGFILGAAVFMANNDNNT